MAKKKLDWKKVLIIGGIAAVYVISPVDLLPLIELDDGIVAFIAAWMIKE